ncbi:LOW QUALITY PROTEIN: dyslexia-associated protein KIAA0319-like protein [Tachypleus tridentatus]|uniref:LOW QUALITY PROTEIN: dyslexia-associated protein KIAA0319-like protein n=1 Tax=Tachypleus tridentatus TaxID=6853 RepID=UPI003FD16B7B
MNRSFLLFLLPVLVLSVNPRLKDNYLEVQCPTSSPTSSQFFIHQSVTPQGNLSAGQYEKISVRTLLECTKACCVKESCDVVFFFDLSCFHIHCKSSELCKPLVRTGEKFKHSYMIQVKDADLRNYSDTLTQKSSELQPKELMSQLDDKRLLETGKNESDHYETPLVAETASSKSSVKPTLIKTCIYGIGENCAINEHCVVHNNRARQGFCECSDGYTRSELTGECQLLTTKNGSNVTATPSLLPTNSTSIKPTATPSPEYENKATGDKKSSSTSTPLERHLVVSAGGNKVIQLPDNEVTLSAYALPQENTGEKYSYLWTLLSQPGGDEEAGIMQGQTSPTLKLSKLRSGVYMFEISVTGNGSSGKDTVSVTVLPPKRTNKPPVAIIQPSNVTVKLPNKDTVLDGSYSTDDDKIVEYHWEVISLPIGCKIQLNNSSTVQLKNLIPGFYRFKLTVKDSDGILNYTFANVTVLKEKDYPPTANAGSDAVIYLPQDDLTLNGNLSSDDKGIKSYQWVKSPETDKSVDMEGTNTPYLHLSHLEVGVYKFILKVTDTSDQMSEAEVHVFVKPESNVPPKAVAGEDINVSLPLDKPVTLDGQKSSDGIKIMKWDWKQVDGPKPATMENDNTSTAQVSHLVPGEYVFRLTVCDDKGQNTSDEIKVIVTQRKNTPPRANAGGDKTINLPCGLVVLNGSKSWDDVEIISFRWTRDPSSLAAGDIIEKSDHSSLLKLINVIPGRYLFHLTVTDEQGVSSSDSASLIVKNPLTLLDQVELVLNADIKSFTAEQEVRYRLGFFKSTKLR